MTVKARLVGGPLDTCRTTNEGTRFDADSIVVQPHRGEYVRTDKFDEDGNRVYEWSGYYDEN